MDGRQESALLTNPEEGPEQLLQESEARGLAHSQRLIDAVELH